MIWMALGQSTGMEEKHEFWLCLFVMQSRSGWIHKSFLSPPTRSSLCLSMNPDRRPVHGLADPGSRNALKVQRIGSKQDIYGVIEGGRSGGIHFELVARRAFARLAFSPFFIFDNMSYAFRRTSLPHNYMYRIPNPSRNGFNWLQLDGASSRAKISSGGSVLN